MSAGWSQPRCMPCANQVPPESLSCLRTGMASRSRRQASGLIRRLRLDDLQGLPDLAQVIGTVGDDAERAAYIAIVPALERIDEGKDLLILRAEPIDQLPPLVVIDLADLP